jgi:hypothetical protein
MKTNPCTPCTTSVIAAVNMVQTKWIAVLSAANIVKLSKKSIGLSSITRPTQVGTGLDLDT